MVNLTMLLGSIAGLTILFLIYKVIELSRRIQKPETIFIDTSGIHSLTERTYIDHQLNKTINFKIGDYVIDICHLPAKRSLTVMANLQLCYFRMKQLLEVKPDDALVDRLKELNFAREYNQIVRQIWLLVKPRVKKKIRTHAALLRLAEKDVTAIFNIAEAVLDYWRPLKKKIDLLSQGETLLSMGGGLFTWNCLKLDDAGKILIRPLFTKLSASENT